MGAFALLVSVLHVHYLIATPVAVEAAVLHNFIWHERYTWKDRTQMASRRRVTWPRGSCVFMQATACHLEILGNVALMRVLVGVLHLNPYVASALSIAICSLLNFAASEWFVFRK